MLLSATDFVQFLPNLRRYARLLTGHQQLGDVLVMSTLQWIASDKRAQPTIEEQRLRLYHVLTRLWRSPVGDHVAGLCALTSDCVGPAERLGAMVPVARASFLLVWVEGFSKPAAAAILDVPTAEFESMLLEAHIAVSRQMATDVLIIEDELLVAFELENIMVSLGHHVTSVVRSKRLAIKSAKQRRPQLILADIQLADGSNGIEAVNEILGDTSMPVIFITAYPERLLTGLRPEPTFVISKPFKTEEIQAVVGQALFFDLKARTGVPVEALASELISGRMQDHI